MAYIPGFEYDIFISYPHVDDLADNASSEEQLGWVTQFHRRLEVELALGLRIHRNSHIHSTTRQERANVNDRYHNEVSL